MRKICNVKWKFLNDFDLFGKEAELYYKGKAKRTTRIGIAFTIIYISMYFAFFIYKVIRMFQKVDVTFYDSYAFTGEPPNIQLTKEKFYGGFALGNPATLQTFVDDTIYYVLAFYIRGVKDGNNWNWEKIPLHTEPCKLESFGEEYRDIFKEKNIDQLHCVPVLDHVLKGFLTYEVYSYYYVKFFPCINGINGRNNCKPLDIVQKYLTQTFVTFKMEDVDLTPQLYDTPVALRGKEVSANVGKSLFQDIRSFFKIVNIETDEDILGFEALQKIKKEKYIQYDESIIISDLRPNVFETGDAICDVTISLSEKELTQKRTYPKLIEVLGDVGGLMEVFFSFFRIISSFLTDTLYETSLVNNLFSFDLDKKVLLIKEKNKDSKKHFFKKSSTKIYLPINNSVSPKSLCPNEEITIQERNIIKDDASSKSKMNNDNILLTRPKKKKKKKKKIKSNFPPNDIKIFSNEKDNYLNGFISNQENEKNNNENKLNPNIKNDKIIENKDEKKIEISIEKGNDNNEKDNDKEKEQKGIINKIKVNKFCTYFCFLFARKRKNMENALIDEGMKLITEKLDILNLFRKIYREELLQDKENLNDINDDIIEMSEECKEYLHSLYKKPSRRRNNESINID